MNFFNAVYLNKVKEIVVIIASGETTYAMMYSESPSWMVSLYMSIGEVYMSCMCLFMGCERRLHSQKR
jgi:hypothetical protein